jgi:hypothetical protein
MNEKTISIPMRRRQPRELLLRTFDRAKAKAKSTRLLERIARVDDSSASGVTRWAGIPL